MESSVIVTSGLSQLDEDMVRYLFKLKSVSLENIEETVGMFSTQRRIIETAERIIEFMREYSRKDSYFFIFLGDETQQNLKLVCNTVVNETEKTRHFAISIHVNWLDFSVKQLTLSGKMFTKIR